MKAFRRRIVVAGVFIVLAACERRGTGGTNAGPTPQPAQDVQLARQSVERAQTSLREVTDVLVRQVAAQNAVGKNDPTVTEAIRQYESLPAAERVKFVVSENNRLRDVFAAWGDPTENLPAPWELRQGRFLNVPTPARATPSFDLANRKTDVFAQQVRLTNALFGDAGAQTMSAVEAWEKMTPDQRRTFIATPDNAALYWQYVYFTYKLQLLRYYHLQTRESYWGYRTPAQIKEIDPRQFDLKTGAQR